MSTPSDTLPNSFTTYALTEDELRQGSILSEVQKRVLQNELASIAEEKLRLTFDPSNPMCFAQQEADLAGRLTVYQHLLSQSEYASDPENYIYQPTES